VQEEEEKAMSVACGEMKIICAWCKVVMRDGTSKYISHGICKECAEKAKSEILWEKK